MQRPEPLTLSVPLSPLVERYETGVRRLEPAGVEVEPPKMILEVDMKPLAPSSPRFGNYYGD